MALEVPNQVRGKSWYDMITEEKKELKKERESIRTMEMQQLRMEAQMQQEQKESDTLWKLRERKVTKHATRRKRRHAEEQMRAVLHAWKQAVKVATKLLKRAKQRTKRQEEQERQDKKKDFEQKQANSLEAFHRLELARTKAQVFGKLCEQTGVTAEQLWKDTWETEILRLKEAACEDAAMLGVRR